MSDITKITAEREKQIQKKKKKTEKNKGIGGRSYRESVRAKLFCCAFKLGFLQLICKASLIFKLNLELDLYIILKQRELYDCMFLSCHVRVWVRVQLQNYMSQGMLRWSVDA